MTFKNPLLVALGLAALVGPLAAQAHVDPRLQERLEAAPADATVPFYAVLDAQVRGKDLAREFPEDLFAPRERRAIFVSRAKAVAEASQAGALAYLRSRPEGQVEDLKPLWVLNAIVARATPEVIRGLARMEGISRVVLRVPSPALAAPAPAPAAQPPAILGSSLAWSVELIRADEVWATGITGAGVVVAGFDTGACYNHPDLQNRVWTNSGEIPNNSTDDDGNGYVDDIYGFDFELGVGDPLDDHGHGTHTMGNVVGDGTSGLQTGVAPGAEFMICKVLDFGSGDGTAVWEAFQYSLENGAHVVTASIGWVTGFHQKDREDWREAADNVAYAGLILVFASGNERNFIFPPECVRTPGDVPSVITVGATDDSDGLASFSSDGPTEWGDDWLGEDTDGAYEDWQWNDGGLIKPDISAPGESVDSTVNCSGYGPNSGTSMATPHIAGVIALMLEANPLLTRDDILEIFEATSLDLGDAGLDNDYGYGRVDAFEAVAAADPHAAVEVVMLSGETLVNPGDVVSFSGSVENVSGSPQTRDYWIDVTRTDGTVVVGALIGPKTATLSPGQRKTFAFSKATQLSSTGTMLVTLKSGTFGGSVEDVSTVAITFR